MPTLLITCLGTRGDVQPFLAIGLSVIKRFPNTKVVFAAHPEFESFILSFSPGFGFTSLTPSLINLLKNSDDGKTIKKSKNPFALFRALKSLNDRMIRGWYQQLLAICDEHLPDLVILPTIGLVSDLQAVLQKKGIPYLVVHTIPAQPTRAFAPPTAAAGFSAPFGWLNWLMWNLSSYIAYHLAFKTSINQARAVLGIEPRQCTLGAQVDQEQPLCIYVYSGSLIPRPIDWSINHQIVGPLNLPVVVEPIPALLMHFIATCDSKKVPILYIGLGSMLEVIFDDTQAIQRVLNTLAQGAFQAIEKIGLGVILHAKPSVDGFSIEHPNLFVLDQPVAHTTLFPRVAAVCHHGGMGTTHAGLLAGKPSLVLPCGPTSDQPFWADVIYRQKLGPKGFLIDQLTKQRFADAIQALFRGLNEFQSNAQTMAQKMIQEPGLSQVNHFLESYLH